MVDPQFLPISAAHHAEILRLNNDFVHWTAPMDKAELSFVLKQADYAKVVKEADGTDRLLGVLLGYAHDTDYPDHKNLIWLRAVLSNFFYIDRIIIDMAAQGRGLGHAFYKDVADFARSRGYDYLACEVNTRPDNPGSHDFHARLGFKAIGEQEFKPVNKAVRYYALTL